MDPADQEMRPLEVYRRLLRYSASHWPVLAIAIIGMIAFAASETGFAWMMKPLLDGSFVERDPEVIRRMPFLVLGLFLLRGVAGFASTYGMAYVGQKVIKELRKELFEHLLRVPTRYFDHHASGQLLGKLTFNVDQVAQAASQALTVVVRDSFKLLGFLGLMFYLNPYLASFTLVVGPLLAILVRWVSRKFRRLSTRIQNNVGEVTHVSEEAIQGERMIKVFGGQAYEISQFERVNEKNRRLQMRRVGIQAASNPVIQIIAALPMAAIVYIASADDILGTMSPGSFAAFLGAMVGLLNPLRSLSNVNAIIQRGIAAASSVFQLLDTAPEPDRGTRRMERALGDIAYDGVSFRYTPDGADVLRDINLEVPHGTSVALVGQSGSGKSTLVNLLPRFYEVERGRITIDGVDIRDIRLGDLRRQISLVSQEVTLFNDTVAANIAYGMLGQVSEEQIINAARIAHAWEFIESLPKGLQTEVGQRGVLLSGGQRQRLAIARALLKDAPILILDEATSALDTESERHIQAGLEALMRNRTTLVIAHRLSTIERVDRIVVLHQGRIVEQGPHEQLLQAGGRYARLHRMQQSAEASRLQSADGPAA